MIALIFAIISALVLVVIAPIMAVWKYYRLSQHSFIMNFVWIFVGILTWPLLPFILAVRHRDVKITTMFWVSFIVWIIAFAVWLATDPVFLQQIQQAQQQLLI